MLCFSVEPRRNAPGAVIRIDGRRLVFLNSDKLNMLIEELLAIREGRA